MALLGGVQQLWNSPRLESSQESSQTARKQWECSGASFRWSSPRPCASGSSYAPFAVSTGASCWSTALQRQLKLRLPVLECDGDEVDRVGRAAMNVLADFAIHNLNRAQLLALVARVLVWYRGPCLVAPSLDAPLRDCTLGGPESRSLPLKYMGHLPLGPYMHHMHHPPSKVASLPGGVSYSSLRGVYHDIVLIETSMSFASESMSRYRPNGLNLAKIELSTWDGHGRSSAVCECGPSMRMMWTLFEGKCSAVHGGGWEW